MKIIDFIFMAQGLEKSMRVLRSIYLLTAEYI